MNRIAVTDEGDLDPRDYHWSDGDLLWEGVFDEDPAFSVPHKVHVFIFRDIVALQQACRDPLACAHALTYRKADGANIRAVIMLAPPVELAQLAHEATHIALHWARDDSTRRKQRAYRWLDKHPENVAELVGNLTAILWYSLPDEYMAEGRR